MPVPALLTAAWKFPPTRAAMIRGGAALAGGLAGKLIGAPETSEYQRRLKEQMDLLQEQMAGLPTPASKAIRSTIRQQSRQAQQALAASAQRAGQTGTSVARGIQARQLGREAERQAVAQGQLSVAAQQQYTQLLGAQEAMAREERGHIQGILNYIMQGVGDAEIREMLMEILRGNQRSTFAPGEAGSAQDLAGRLPSSGDIAAQAPSLSAQQAPSFQQQLGPVAPRALSLHEASIPLEAGIPTTAGQPVPLATSATAPQFPLPAIPPERMPTGVVPTAPMYERPGMLATERATRELAPTTFAPRETLGAPTTLPTEYESIIRSNVFGALQPSEAVTTQPALGPPQALATLQPEAEVQFPKYEFPIELLDDLRSMERLLEGDRVQRGFYDYRWNELRRRYNLTEQEMRDARYRASWR